LLKKRGLKVLLKVAKSSLVEYRIISSVGDVRSDNHVDKVLREEIDDISKKIGIKF